METTELLDNMRVDAVLRAARGCLTDPEGIDRQYFRALLFETLATIAHDSQAGKYCYLAGDRFVAVPEKHERAFRTALKKLGFVLRSHGSKKAVTEFAGIQQS